MKSLISNASMITSVILFLASISIVHCYGYGMFGRGPWMTPFRPYLPSPFAHPFASSFAPGFSGFGGGIPAAGGYGFGLKRAGIVPMPFAPVSPFAAASAAAVSPFAAPVSPFGGFGFFPSPFSGFGAAPSFSGASLVPSIGSFASASKPSFSIMKLGSSHSGSSDPKEVTVAEGISDHDLVAEATGNKRYIYGFRGRKYHVGKPWDVFSKRK